MDDRQDKPNIALIGVGTLFASMVLGGFILGYAIDVWIDTNPWFMLGFGFFGLLGGILKAHKLLT